MALNGLENIVAPSEENSSNLFDRKSFYVLENVGLEVISAICKQNIKVVDSSIILKEFHCQKRLIRFFCKN